VLLVETEPLSIREPLGSGLGVAAIDLAEAFDHLAAFLGKAFVNVGKLPTTVSVMLRAA